MAASSRLATSSKQLVVRKAPEMESALVSRKIDPGTALVVLEMRDLADGTTRGHVALQESPTVSMGWVTLRKEGVTSVVFADAEKDTSSTGNSSDASPVGNMVGAASPPNGASPNQSPMARRKPNSAATPTAVEWATASKRCVLLERLAGAELKFVLQVRSACPCTDLHSATATTTTTLVAPPLAPAANAHAHVHAPVASAPHPLCTDLVVTCTIASPLRGLRVWVAEYIIWVHNLTDRRAK